MKCDLRRDAQPLGVSMVHRQCSKTRNQPICRQSAHGDIMEKVQIHLLLFRYDSRDAHTRNEMQVQPAADRKRHFTVIVFVAPMTTRFRIISKLILLHLTCALYCMCCLRSFSFSFSFIRCRFGALRDHLRMQAVSSIWLSRVKPILISAKSVENMANMGNWHATFHRFEFSTR